MRRKIRNLVTIIGGGPSAQPWIGKIDSPVIGVNQAALYQKVDWCIWSDRQWWVKWGEQVRQTGAELWTIRGMYPPDVHVLSVQTSNSGAAAIWLAMHLGYKEIHLIGYDFECVNGQPNFHKDYNRVTHERAWYQKMWLKDFQLIDEYAREIGIEILNLNPQSKLTLFPFLEQPTTL
jgi:hypothetical protein